MLSNTLTIIENRPGSNQRFIGVKPSPLSSRMGEMSPLEKALLVVINAIIAMMVNATRECKNREMSLSFIIIIVSLREFL